MKRTEIKWQRQTKPLPYNANYMCPYAFFRLWERIIFVWKWVRERRREIESDIINPSSFIRFVYGSYSFGMFHLLIDAGFNRFEPFGHIIGSHGSPLPPLPPFAPADSYTTIYLISHVQIHIYSSIVMYIIWFNIPMAMALECLLCDPIDLVLHSLVFDRISLARHFDQHRSIQKSAQTLKPLKNPLDTNRFRSVPFAYSNVCRKRSNNRIHYL